MKRLLVGLFAVILIVVFSVTFWLISQPTFEDNWPVDEKYTSYYLNTYEESRAAFRKSCTNLKQRFPKTEETRLSVDSKMDNDLTIDICSVSQISKSNKPSKKLLILTSGIHGGEAYTSSAVQRMVMDELILGNASHPDLLFVHSINPFGMKHFRRVTENNIDLNRNFDDSIEIFKEKNSGYTEVFGLLNPTGKADVSSIENRFFAFKAIYQIISKGMSPLRQAILQGQYEHEKGIYFGGNDFEQQKKLLDPILKKYSVGKGFIVLVDLHTGYGERGVAHLFPNTPPNDLVRESTEKLFAGNRIDWPGGDFYSTHGDFSVYVGKLLQKTVNYIPMVFEYGTLDSQTTKGSIISIHNSILENQSAHYGCESESDCTEIQKRYREMFYPTSLSWRSKVISDSVKLFNDTLSRMSEY